jgi:hypothetical protein
MWRHGILQQKEESSPTIPFVQPVDKMICDLCGVL